MLMSEIRGIVNQIIEERRSTGGPKLDIHDIHLLLCGDLNSLPDSGKDSISIIGNSSKYFVLLENVNLVFFPSLYLSLPIWSFHNLLKDFTLI